MTTFYIAPKNNENIARITGDFSEETIIFNEAVFFAREKSIWILGEFEKITGLKKIGDDNFTFTPQLCAVEIHGDTYQKNVKNSNGTWSKKDIKPTIAEKAIYHLLKEQLYFLDETTRISIDGTQAYSGTIYFDYDPETALGIYRNEILYFNYIIKSLNPVPTNKTKDIINLYSFGENKQTNSNFKSFKNTSEISQERLDWIIEKLGITSLCKDRDNTQITDFQQVVIYLHQLGNNHQSEFLEYQNELTIIFKLLSLCLK